jgi:hypothetical protein
MLVIWNKIVLTTVQLLYVYSTFLLRNDCLNNIEVSGRTLELFLFTVQNRQVQGYSVDVIVSKPLTLSNSHFGCWHHTLLKERILFCKICRCDSHYATIYISNI